MMRADFPALLPISLSSNSAPIRATDIELRAVVSFVRG
jgi:hypothetical protein